VSGYHGQLDQIAILPAIAALMAWERLPVSRRATQSGLLLGLGAATKTVPGLLTLPLLASARSVREGAKLLGAAAALLAIVMLPFVIADPSGVLEMRHYKGWPGLGGLSLVTDPGIGSAWLEDGIQLRDPTALGEFVYENSGAITLLATLALAVFLFRYRPAPVDGAVLLWLTIYAFSPNFFMHYLVWGLPFFIMAGYLREVAILQLALMPALLIYYLAPFPDPMPAAAIYVPSMIALWLLWVVALVTLAKRTLKRRPARAPAAQPPLVDVGATLGQPVAIRSGSANSG